MIFTLTGPLCRKVDEVDLTDLTSAKRTGRAVWVSEGVLDIPFDRALTVVEADAVMLRLTNRSNEMATARANLDKFLAMPAPTPVQVVSAFKDFVRLYLANSTDRG